MIYNNLLLVVIIIVPNYFDVYFTHNGSRYFLRFTDSIRIYVTVFF